MILLLLLSLSLLGCAPSACHEACTDFGAFVDACGDADGRLCGGDMWADCVDDADTWLECSDAGFEGDACDYDALAGAGVVHECGSGGEAESSCHRVADAHWRRLETDAERTEYTDSCEDDSDWDRMIREKDCDGVCAAMGL